MCESITLVYKLSFYINFNNKRKWSRFSPYPTLLYFTATYFRYNHQVIPWNTLKYLIGEVMYGGRVIDDFDRRIVNTYMDEYMGDFLFDTFQPFHFYVDETVDYYIPDDGPKESYQVLLTTHHSLLCLSVVTYVNQSTNESIG